MDRIAAVDCDRPGGDLADHLAGLVDGCHRQFVHAFDLYLYLGFKRELLKKSFL